MGVQLLRVRHPSVTEIQGGGVLIVIAKCEPIRLCDV